MTLKNIKNDAIITIINIQSADGTEEKTELITSGKFYKSNNKFYIIYSEDESEETSACSVMIIISEDEVVINRKGDFSSKMHYSEGKAEQIVYHTPYGNMSFILKTLNINNQLSECGGMLNLLYELSLNGDIINNNLTINVKKQKG